MVRTRLCLCLCLLICGLLAAASAANAVEAVGQLVELRGTLFLHKGSGPNYEKIETPGASLLAGDTLRSPGASRGTIRFADGSRILLDERSTIHFKSAAEAALQGGTALFDMNRQGRISGFTVSSPVATIGIRGTQFAVEISEEQETAIYLEQGAIEVLPIQEQFKRYRGAIKGEFDDWRKQQQGEAAEYKRRLQQEYFDYVSGFTMTPGNAVSIRGNEVRDTVPGDRLRQLMKEFFGASTLPH